jgi:hypothetical protein
MGGYPLFEEEIMNNARKVNPLLILAIAFATGPLASCLAPNDSSLMELNRSGKWREAERVGSDMLAHRRTFSFSQLSETYYHVAYAQTRMGKKEEAARTLKEYDAFSGGGTLDWEHLWLDREFMRLKNELGLLDGVQRVLVEAMEENGKGGYARARELCADALRMKGLTDKQRATAHFVAAACSIKLKDAPAAESHLAEFDSIKAGLSSEDLRLFGEEEARRDLADLEAATD